MNIVVGARGAGKTRKLMELADENDWLMVVRDREEAARIFHEALELKLNISVPITYDEFFSHQYYGKGIKGFLIDDLEIFLMRLTTVRIGAVAFTTPDRTFAVTK